VCVDRDRCCDSVMGGEDDEHALAKAKEIGEASERTRSSW